MGRYGNVQPSELGFQRLTFGDVQLLAKALERLIKRENEPAE